MNTHGSYFFKSVNPTFTKWYAGSDLIKAGSVMCYDSAGGNPDTADTNVTKCTLANALDPAGLVAGEPGESFQGPCQLPLYPLNGAQMRDVYVLTDENIAAGDFLSPIPGSYHAGKHLFGSRPIMRALEAQDRSATAGVVRCVVGDLRAFESAFQKKVVRFFDHFLNTSLSTTADASNVRWVGANSTVSLADALGPEAAAAKQAAGALSLTTATTGFECTAQLNGEPFRLDKPLFFAARVAQSAISGSVHSFAGLALGASTDILDASGTDYMGFRGVDAAQSFIYAKDGSDSAIETATGATSQSMSDAIVADTFVELAFMVRKSTVTIWRNGVEIAHTTVAADICDNESLTLCLGIDDDDGAATLLVDWAEVMNYVG